jgi:hypothetical protein
MVSADRLLVYFAEDAEKAGMSQGEALESACEPVKLDF